MKVLNFVIASFFFFTLHGMDVIEFLDAREAGKYGTEDEIAERLEKRQLLTKLLGKGKTQSQPSRISPRNGQRPESPTVSDSDKRVSARQQPPRISPRTEPLAVGNPDKRGSSAGNQQLSRPISPRNGTQAESPLGSPEEKGSLIGNPQPRISPRNGTQAESRVGSPEKKGARPLSQQGAEISGIEKPVHPKISVEKPLETVQVLLDNGKEAAIPKPLVEHLQALQFIPNARSNGQLEKLPFLRQSQALEPMCALFKLNKLYSEEAEADMATQKFRTDIIHWAMIRPAWDRSATPEEIWGVYKLEQKEKNSFRLKNQLDATIRMKFPKEVRAFFPCFTRDDIHALELDKFDSFTLSVMRQLVHMIYNFYTYVSPTKLTKWNETLEYDADLHQALINLLKYCDRTFYGQQIGFLKIHTLITLAKHWKIHPIARAIAEFKPEKLDAAFIAPDEVELLTRHAPHKLFLAGLFRSLVERNPESEDLNKALETCFSPDAQDASFEKLLRDARECSQLDKKLVEILRTSCSVVDYKKISDASLHTNFSQALLINGRYLVGMNTKVTITDLQKKTEIPEQEKVVAEYTPPTALVGIVPFDKDSFVIVAKNHVMCIGLKEGTCETRWEFERNLDPIQALCVISNAQDNERLLIAGRRWTQLFDRRGKPVQPPLIQNQMESFLGAAEASIQEDPAAPAQMLIKAMTINGPYVCASLTDNSLLMWHFDAQNDMQRKLDNRISSNATKGYSAIKTQMCINDGKKDRRVIISYADRVVLFACDSGMLLGELKSPNNTALCFAQIKEDIMAIGYSNGELRIWDLAAPKNAPEIIDLKGVNQPIINLSYAKGTLTAVLQNGAAIQRFLKKHATSSDWMQKFPKA